MLLINVDPSQWSDDMHPEYMTFTQQIIESGEFVSGEPLQGPEAATTVRVRDGGVATTDGPYVESKEHVGGYYVVDVKDLDRAIELAAKIPDARTGGVEVRPILELEM
jgi:hypothetical protein